MCSCLQGDKTSRYLSKRLLHRFRCRRYFLFQRSEEHTSELQSLTNLVCRLLSSPSRLSPLSLHDALPISFRLLLVINSTFCACATINSCLSSVNSRLTHGECVPVSRAIRLRGIFPNVCFIASGVVATFCSRDRKSTRLNSSH